MRPSLRIGSRGSRLALWQAEFIKSSIQAKFPEVDIELSVIRTTGDKVEGSPLSKIGGKGVFVKEIEDALLDGEIDLAVHSMKDLPSILPKGLKIGAVAEREDPRDALVSVGKRKLCQLPQGARLGTGSIRRQAQLLHLRPDLRIVPVRGNVDTRVRRLESNGLEGIILAMAGLRRMGLEGEVSEAFPPETLVPSPGQGVIAVESREGDKDVDKINVEINHRGTEISAFTERAFLERLSGSCQLPAGCYAEIIGGGIRVTGLVISPDGREVVRDYIKGPLTDHIHMGRELAERILQGGGARILSAISGSEVRNS